MRIITTFLLLALVSVFAVLTDGCMSGLDQVVGQAMADQIAPPISLALMCDMFWNKNQRWPKDYMELSKFIRQYEANQSNENLMIDHYYAQVVLTHLKDGSLEIYCISKGETNQNYTVGVTTNQMTLSIPK
jgi:hypothetical protein